MEAMDPRTLVSRLQERCPARWPDLWGAVYQHRSACPRVILELVDELLADPRMTRSQLREELARALQLVEESGP